MAHSAPSVVARAGRTVQLLTVVAIAFVGLTGQALAQPAPGGPPNPPLARTDPRLWDTTLTMTMGSDPVDVRVVGSFSSSQWVLSLPMILRGSYSKIDPTSISARLSMNGKRQSTDRFARRMRTDRPDGIDLADIDIGTFTGQSIQVEFTFRAQAWRSVIDDAAAGTIAWPVEWPEDAQPFLEPTPWIQSDAPLFAEFVQNTSGGTLRQVPPYFAAKDLIRATINEFRAVAQGFVEQRRLGQTTATPVNGALRAAQEGRGTKNDLVCTCVAVLRAAGIPARPVIGVVKPDRGGRGDSKQTRTGWASWGEFYLPGCGWVPFDPNEMRGGSLNQLDVRRPWKWLGTIRELDHRVALSYEFQPAGSPWYFDRDARDDRFDYDQPTVWGITHATNLDWTRRLYSTISMMMVSRGKGEDDPS